MIFPAWGNHSWAPKAVLETRFRNGGVVRLRSISKIWAIAVVCLVIAQAGASMFLPKCYRLTAITDWISLALMLSAALAFARNAFGSNNHRQRLVWILLGAGYAVEACGQILWMHWDLVVKQTP